MRLHLFLLLPALATALPAQQSDTAKTRRDSTAQRLPTLDVTTAATRSTRPVLQQPIAVTELTPREWAGRKGGSLDEALTFVPGVVAQNRAGWTDMRLVIRGFGARGAGDRSNAGTARGVRVLLDGFPETEPDGRTALDLVDLSAAGAIEVVRSNASAVWGNSAGGVVNVSTLRNASSPWALFEPAAGSFGFQRYGVQAGYQPGGGELGGTALWAKTDGWRDHSTGERLLLNAAASLGAGRTGRLGVFAAGGYNQYDIPGPLTMAQVEEDPTQANPVYAARTERRFNRLGRLGAAYEAHFGEHHELRSTLYVSPKYLQRSERGTFRDFTRYHLGGSLLYRYTAPIGTGNSSTTSIGMDEAYQDGAILFYSLTPEGNRGPTLRDNKREGANNLGVFIQEELDLGERWGLSAGARFDRISYHYESYVTPDLSDAKDFERLSPKVGVNYRFSPTHALYANIGGGVEAPAGNETDPVGTYGQDSVYAINPLLEPIISTSYELGTKHVATFGGGTHPFILNYDAAAYLTNVQNEIVPYRGGRFSLTAGSARRSGAELAGRLQWSGLAFHASFAWAHHRYTDYDVDSVHYGKPGATADYSGNKVVGVPDWTHAVGLNWEPAAVPGLRAGLTVQGTSSYWADDANSIKVDGYSIASVTVGMDRPVRLSGDLGLRGWVSINNLFDRGYIGSAYLNPDVVNGVPVAYEPGLPRNVVLSLSLGWMGDR
jgi:iron complex outermembrane receptor protein